jgi:hypothetical protein
MLGVGLLSATLAAAQLAAAPLAAAQRERGPEPKDEPGSQLVGDGIIIPGQRVGPLRLSMTIDQMVPLLPRTVKREVFKDQRIVLYEWYQQGVWVSLDDATKAVRLISVFGSAPYKTDKGVQLLHPESRMQAVYGKETKRYEYPEDRLTLVRYVPLGLQFGLVNQPSNRVLHGRIFTIGVFVPGKEPPLTKTPR